MKAVIWTRYGPPEVLTLRERPTPTPGDDELLVRIRATTVTMGDCELRGFKSRSVFALAMRLYLGPLRPRRIQILGQELAGEVQAVGKDVTRFRAGDRIFAATGFRLRAYAQYTCLPEKGMVALKPGNVSYEEAAAIPLGGLEAWQYLSRADLRPGRSVLINGAGGSIGVIAVQLARREGAQVTAVDSAEKLEMLRAIGAEQVIDYRQQDFTENGQTYDLIFDVIGSHSAASCARSLKSGGRYLSANPGARQQLRGLWQLITRRRQVVATYTRQRQEGLAFLSRLLEAGELRPVIDRRYTLEEIVEAHHYVETGRKQGSVVVTVGHEPAGL